MKRIRVFDELNRLKLVPYWRYCQIQETGSSGSELSIDVDAYCVAGETGILAFFFWGDLFCVASGDDGFWNLIWIAAKDWFESIHDILHQMFVEEVVEKVND